AYALTNLLQFTRCEESWRVPRTSFETIPVLGNSRRKCLTSFANSDNSTGFCGRRPGWRFGTCLFVRRPCGRRAASGKEIAYALARCVVPIINPQSDDEFSGASSPSQN